MWSMLTSTTKVEALCIIHSILIGAADGRLMQEGLFFKRDGNDITKFTTCININAVEF